MNELLKDSQLEEIEIRLLLEGIYSHYGQDYRDYAPSSLKRRIREAMRNENVKTVSGFQEKVLHDLECMERFSRILSINVTSMFRDPSFYLTFRTKVVPMLKTYPFVRIWHAGCATGEEVYSMAILLMEEDLYSRCRIYATDINKKALKTAKDGIYPIASMKEFTSNYMASGGKNFFSDYYTAHYDNVIFSSSLRENILFSEHNLATDGSFNEFHVVLCRNVMIYFNKKLQERVHKLIYDSLSIFGILGIGNKESLRFTPQEEFYEELDERDRLYKKVR
jgi:chemotaxis protein methyltransferase CheR